MKLIKVKCKDEKFSVGDSNVITEGGYKFVKKVRPGMAKPYWETRSKIDPKYIQFSLNPYYAKPGASWSNMFFMYSIPGTYREIFMDHGKLEELEKFDRDFAKEKVNVEALFKKLWESGKLT